jgi:hypothetical protein
MTVILTGVGTVVTVVGANIGLIAWLRSDMKMFESEIRDWKNEINKEMKDFHGRLCAIEERNKKGWIIMNEDAGWNLSNLLSFKDFSRKHLDFSESSLRWRYAEAKKTENEFYPTFYEVSGRILIHENKFLDVYKNKIRRNK